MSKVFSVAIDGPVGAGKSCVAKKVAERLNAAYLDTGAMYRAVGLYMLENGVSLEDGAAIAENAGKARVDVRYEGREQRTYLNGRDVTGELRRPEVSLASSAVAKVHAVREALVNRQRELARGISLVMDGRDIGTCVLTDATLKIFLTAAPEERARRRFRQMNGRGRAERSDSPRPERHEPRRIAASVRGGRGGAGFHQPDRGRGRRAHRVAADGTNGGRAGMKRGFCVFLCVVYRLFAMLFHPVRVIGRENMVREGSVILCANHVSLQDPMVLDVYLGRLIRFMAKKELFENRFMNRVMTWLGAFPVSRGESDLSAMRTSLKLLADGEALGIFPEGHRYVDGEMHEFGNGLALIALRSGAPVVPAYIQGSYRLFRRVTVTVGAPVALDDLGRRCDSRTLSAATERIQNAMRALREGDVKKVC